MNAIFIFLGLCSVTFAMFAGPANLDALVEGMLSAANSAVQIVISLLGVLALFLGLYQVAYASGLTQKLARFIAPVLRVLLPEVPATDQAHASMSLNLSANVLGLGNAATPFGIQAMHDLRKLITTSVASRAMMVFLVINTSSVTLIPVKVIALRVAAGAAHPTDVILPTIFATICSTLVGLALVLLMHPVARGERIQWLPVIKALAVITIILAALIQFSSYALPLIIAGILLFGAFKRVNVYEQFIEGAKGAIDMILRIIPFAVAILAFIGMFRTSGAMDVLLSLLAPVANLIAVPAEVLPMAIMRPLTGSGALAYLTEVLTTVGPDTSVGLMCSTLMGSTETTFYVLAVYFGAVGIKEAKGVLLPALSADLAGALASVAIVHWITGDLASCTRVVIASGIIFSIILMFALAYRWRTSKSGCDEVYG